MRIENNEINFSWYSTDKEQAKKVALDIVKEKIKKILLSTPLFTIKADIPTNLMYNKWKDKQEYQKICFNVYEPPKKNWAKGFSHFVRAFGKLNKTQYQNMVVKGGTFSISVHWKDGCLMVDKIQELGVK